MPEKVHKSKDSRRYSSWGKHYVDLQVRLNFDGVVSHSYVLNEHVIVNTPSGDTVAIPIECGVSESKKEVPVLSAIVDGENRKTQDDRIIQELLGRRKSARKQSMEPRASDDKPDDNVINESRPSTSTGTIMVDVFGRD